MFVILQANERASSFEAYFAAVLGLQALSFLWLSGFHILAVALLVLSANVGYIWYQYRSTPQSTGNLPTSKALTLLAIGNPNLSRPVFKGHLISSTLPLTFIWTKESLALCDCHFLSLVHQENHSSFEPLCT